MKFVTHTMVSALLLFGTASFADAEHPGGEARSGDKTVRTVKPAKTYHREMREPGSTTSAPPKVKTVKPSDSHPVYRHQKPQPIYTHRPPVKVKTAKKTKTVRKPFHSRPLPYYHRPGYAVRTLPYAAVTLTFGGLFFYYTDGIYYRHDHNRYVVALPPVGLLVPALPPAHSVVILGGRKYYTYADVYYVWDEPRGAYRVIEAPLYEAGYLRGDIVDSLPDNAYSVTIEGKHYFRFGDTYFLQSVQNGEIVYVVVTP